MNVLGCIINVDGDEDSDPKEIKVFKISTFFSKDLQIPALVMGKKVLDAVIYSREKQI